MRAPGSIAVLALALLGLTAGCRELAAQEASPKPARPPAALAQLVKLELLVKGFRRPLALEFAPGDRSGRMFVVEQGGKIHIVRGGKIEPKPFLDVSAKVTRTDEEQGLLGLAFHPRHGENGRFYVNYTARDDNTRVVEYRVAKDSPDRADPASARELLFVEQNGWNHNGGHVTFGPDGKLWIGMGDGGGAGDPDEHGQNPTSRLGKMLRLDVDAPKKGPEIVAKGLRNPWRYTFDRKTGDLYIGDVGQRLYEEVNVVPAGKLTGHNFGWDVVEGMGHCFNERDYERPLPACDQKGMTPPVAEYSSTEGCSVVGGFVYRGKAIPELDGVYFYADYCTGLLRSFRWKGAKAVDAWDWRDVLDPAHKLAKVASFGQDADGELYLVSLDGLVYKLVRR